MTSEARHVCRRKRRFGSRSDAMLSMNIFNKPGVNPRGGKLHAYRCPHCRGWHLGKLGPSEEDRRL